MFSFIISQTSTSWKAQAEQGAHDDLIMSLAIAWQLYQTENPEVKRTKKITSSGNVAQQMWGRRR